MPFERRTPTHAWREKLTTEELAQVAAIEADVRRLMDERIAASARLAPIRNRAIQRCRHALLVADRAKG